MQLRGRRVAPPDQARRKWRTVQGLLDDVCGDRLPRAFSTPGDSGSVLGNANSHIVGMLTARPTLLALSMCRHTTSSTVAEPYHFQLLYNVHIIALESVGTSLWIKQKDIIYFAV